MCKVRGLKRSKVGSGEGEDLYYRFRACALTPYDHLIGEEKSKGTFNWKTNPHYEYRITNRSAINQQ